MLPEVIRHLSVLVFTICLSDTLNYDYPLHEGNYDVRGNFYDESSNSFNPINIYNQNGLLSHIHNRKGPSKLFDPSIVPLNKFLDNRKNEEKFKPVLDRKFVGIGDIKNDLRLMKSVKTTIENKEKPVKVDQNSSCRTIKDINKLSSPQLNLRSDKLQRIFHIPYKNVDDHSSFTRNTPCLAIAHKIYLHNEVLPNAIDYDDVNSMVIGSNGFWKNIPPNNFDINMPCPKLEATICLNPKKEYYDNINLTPTFIDSFWKNIEAFDNVNHQYTNPKPEYPKSEYSEHIQQVPSENFDSQTYLNSNFPCQVFGLNECLYKQQYSSIPFSKVQNLHPNLFYHESRQHIPTNYINPNVQNQYHSNNVFIDNKGYGNQKNPNKNEEEFAIYKTIHTTSYPPKIFVNKPNIICPQVAKNTKHYVNRYIHFMFSKPIHDLLLRTNILTELELQILEYYRSITNEIIGKPNLILKYHNILLKMLEYLQKANLKQRFHKSLTYTTKNNNNERSFSKTELEAVRLLGLFEKYFKLAKEKLYNTLKNNQYLRTKDFNLYVTLFLNVIPDLGTIENVMNDENSNEENSEEKNSLTPYFGFLTQTENDMSVEVKINKINYMIDMQIFCGEMVNENHNNNAVPPLMVVKPLDIIGSQYDNSEDSQEINSSVAKINGYKSEEYFYYDDNDEPHVVELHVIDDKSSLDVQKSKDKKSQEFLTRTTGQAQLPVSINYMDGVFDKFSKYSSPDNGRPNPEKKNPIPANGKNVSLKETLPVNKDVNDSSGLSPLIQKKHELIKSVSEDDKNGNKNQQKDIKEISKISSSATRDGIELFTTDKSFIPNWNLNVPASHEFRLNKLNFYDNKIVSQVHTPHATGQITKNRFRFKPNHKIKINDYNRLPKTQYHFFVPYVVDHPEQSHPHYKYKPGFDTDFTLKSITPRYNYKNSPSRLNYYRNLLQYNSYNKPDGYHQEILQEPQFLKQKIPWNYSYQNRIINHPLYKRDFIINTPLLNHHIENEGLKGDLKIPRISKRFDQNLEYVGIVDNKYSVPDLIRDSEYNKPRIINTPGYELGPYHSLVEDGNFHHIPFIQKLEKQEYLSPMVHGNYFGIKQPYNIINPKSVVDNTFVAPDAIHKSVVNRLNLVPNLNVVDGIHNLEAIKVNLLPILHHVDGVNRQNKSFYGQSSLSSELNKLSDKTSNHFIKEVVEPRLKIETNIALDKVGQNVNNILHKLQQLELIKPKEVSENTEVVKDLTSLNDEEQKDKRGLIALIALKKFRRNLQGL
ncbi:hypothetical protein K1T71_011892 [Dendrolimus kikuchii]|uniref:Uncharacterized protein n=1 Tax=Dendrolimus kikuchii TaxID=765133 RepID=A0ACC1CMJ3_9NEOP|nr:hypothetical protein K1T71_011892 [Dendrolimus kikuchii]